MILGDKLLYALMRPLSRLLRRLAAAPPEIRRELQSRGVHVLPVSFYSSVPTIAEVESSYEYRPGEEAAYLDPRIFDHDALDQLLEELLPFAAEFAPPATGDPESGAFYWDNGYFTHSDALAYYCCVRRFRPSTILEVGSGFSTLVAREALRRNGTGRLVCVEPEPRGFLVRDSSIELVRAPAQSLDLSFFRSRLRDGDFLFVDSTHTVKTGSDCLHLYLRVLPRIERDLIVHAHDIFLPFGMPKDWLVEQQLFWTEQYLLLALLTDNPRARLLWSSPYHRNFNTARLERFTAGKWTIGGGSFWFRYAGRAEVTAAGSEPAALTRR
jgi:hypothetical protein